MNFTRETRILKAEAHHVIGVVLVPNEIDSQDDVVSPEEIAKAEADYRQRSRRVGLRHAGPAAGAELVESWIEPRDTQIGGQPVKAGTWLVKIRIDSPELWQQVQAHQLDALSIGGMGTRERA